MTRAWTGEKNNPENLLSEDILLKLTKYTKDEYWLDLLTSLHEGRIKGFVFKNGALSFKGLKKTPALVLDKVSRKKFAELLEFMKKNGGFSSPNEEISEKNSDHTTDCEWKDIKKESNKRNIIEQFVHTKSKEFGMGERNRKISLCNILLGISQKRINDADINYSKGKIIDISGVKYVPSRGALFISSSKKEKLAKAKSKKKGTKKELNFSNYLEKFYSKSSKVCEAFRKALVR